MADAWLGDVGIRVTDLDRSIRFYTTLLDLEELVRSRDDDSAYVLFRDRRSGQRLELNWYSEDNPFYTPYVPGEGLDHLEVRVRDVPATLERLRTIGILPATKKLWTNPRGIEKVRKDPQWAATFERLHGQDIWEPGAGHRIAYIQDPDGLFVCLYDHPEEAWEGPIPDHY